MVVYSCGMSIEVRYRMLFRHWCSLGTTVLLSALYSVLIWAEDTLGRPTTQTLDVCGGGLNENDPHKLSYLNTLFPVDGTVWEVWPCWRRCVGSCRL